MDFIKQLSLSGKRALVCGASQGIGEAVALNLASLGAEVVLLARSKDGLERVRKRMPGQGHQILALDLAETASMETPLKAFLPFHIVVNNAGGPPSGSLLAAEQEDFLSALQTHLLAAQKIAQLTVPGMKELRYGRIINIISTSVKAPLPHLGVSNTVRGAVANWAKSLASEVGPFGITVNNVLPGYTKTQRLEVIRKATAVKSGLSEQEVEDKWKASVPLARFADAEEVAHAVAFLASPAASYISGINLPVDGGRTPSL